MELLRFGAFLPIFVCKRYAVMVAVAYEDVLQFLRGLCVEYDGIDFVVTTQATAVEVG